MLKKMGIIILCVIVGFFVIGIVVNLTMTDEDRAKLEKEIEKQPTKTQQDCIDEAEKSLSKVTLSSIMDQNLIIFVDVEEDYTSCMEKIGIYNWDNFYGLSNSQAKKITDTSSDCDFDAVTQNTGNQEKMENEIKKCDVQYVQMVKDVIESNR